MKSIRPVATTVNRYGTHSLIDLNCPNCGAFTMHGFYAARNVPVHDVRVFHTRQEALDFPRGDIHLAYCWKCGFITNVSFDPSTVNYSPECEETQGYSPTFGSFHQRLATYMIEKYDLHGKKILEIGCGKGEFLALLCESGNNHGIGFDPAFVPERTPQISRGQVEYIADLYSEKYSNIDADFVVCKMTLEHIAQPREFVSQVRKAIGNRSGVHVFFQIPEVFRVLRELAFWDIYYEHCSYFSAGSLGRLFRLCGFDVHDLWTDYDDQYLMVEASPGVSGSLALPLPQENDLAQLFPLAGYFSQAIKSKLQTWRNRLSEFHASGQRVVLWGGGSKAVAFLSTLGIKEQIEYVVDINPHKHGTYLAGTGQEVVPPIFLKDYKPDAVIAMNPVYVEEIQAELSKMDLSVVVIPINK